MMRGLFSDVVPFRVVWILPIAGEGFSEDGVQWLFHSAASCQAIPLVENG